MSNVYDYSPAEKAMGIVLDNLAAWAQSDDYQVDSHLEHALTGGEDDWTIRLQFRSNDDGFEYGDDEPRFTMTVMLQSSIHNVCADYAMGDIIWTAEAMNFNMAAFANVYAALPWLRGVIEEYKESML